MKRFLLLGMACLLVSGCGGGGGGSSSSGSTGSGSGGTTSPTTYTIGGSVTGLSGSVTLLNSDGDQLTVSANGSFTFPTAEATGTAYAVTVGSVTPATYSCTVSNGSGTLASANVSNISVSCSAPAQTAMGCGTVTSIGSANVAPLVVDGFPCAAGGTAGAANAANVPYVAIKVCAPGSTTNCQIIDHITVDTGSTGLRLAASALSSSLQPGAGLPLVAGSTSGSTTLTECEAYVSSYAYGPVVSADIYIAGKLVQSGRVQVFGASGFAVPRACSSQGGSETDTTQTFGGNGLIGVGFDLLDQSQYFDCQSANLSQCTVDNTYQGLPNPVSQFSADNNGVAIELPTIPAAGQNTAVVGALVFGVATQTNNTPTTSTIPIVNDASGTFNAQVGGVWYSAYLDSGTSVTYFNDHSNSSLTDCASTDINTGLYCPASTQSVSFTLANAGSETSTGTLSFQVANADSVYTETAVAFDDIAGPITSSTTTSSSIAFGLTNYYGHTIYFLFNGKTAPGTGLGGSSSTTVTGPINGVQ